MFVKNVSQIWDLRYIFQKHTNLRNVFHKHIAYVYLKRKIFSSQLCQFQLLLLQSYYVCDNHASFVIFLFVCFDISVNEKNNFYLFESIHKFNLIQNSYLLLGSNPRPCEYESIVLPMQLYRVDIWRSLFWTVVHNVKR